MKYIMTNVNEVYNENDTLPYSSLIPMDAYHFYTLAGATTDYDIQPEQVPNGSVFAIHLYDDNTVQAEYNDQSVSLLGCTKGAVCATKDFLAALEAKVGHLNIELECNPPSM